MVALVERATCAACSREWPSGRVASDFSGMCPGCLAGFLGVEPEPEPARVVTGVRIAGYEIVERLGEGGMGVVYRARHPSDGRQVALKVLSPKLASPEFEQRFNREAQALAGLRHPNVVRVHESGRDGDLVYLVMELIEGRSLQDALDDGPFAPERLLPVVRQIAAGLSAVHAAGLVHRDVKPSNVLVAADGTVTLTDFGLVAETAPTTRLTQTGEFLGSPHYMAPEYLQGRAVDGRADLYALGVLIYQALTGRLPFTARHAAALIAMHLQQQAPVGALPDPWRRIAGRLLQKDPAARYASAGELERDLEAPRTSRRFGLSIAAAAVMVAALGGAFALRSPPGPPAAGVPGPVDILPLLDVAEDTVTGAWAVEDGALVVKRAFANSRYEIPYGPGEEFDILLTAQRILSKGGGLGLVVPFGRAQVWVALGAYGEATSGIDYLSGRPTRNATSRAGDIFGGEHPRAIRVAVRRDGVSAHVDGDLVAQWSGSREFDTSGAKLTGWDHRAPFLMVSSLFRFTAMSIVPVSGVGARLRAGPRPAPVEPEALAEIDLLAEVDFERDALAGLWRREESGAITMLDVNDTGTVHARWAPPDEYDVHVVAETLDPARGGLSIGLPLRDGCDTSALLDETHPTTVVTGLAVDAQPRHSPTVVHGRVMRAGQSLIVVRVRRDGVALDVEGRTIIDWKGRPQRCKSGDPQPPLRLSSWGTPYRIHRWTLVPRGATARRIAEPEVAAPLAGMPGPMPGSSLDLLALVDPARHAIHGTWTLGAQGLESGREPMARLQVPYAPPEEYDVSATVACADGSSGVFFGIACSGAFTTVGINANQAGQRAGLFLLDTKNIHRNRTNVDGRHIGTEPTDVLISVRSRRITVDVAGTRIIEWEGAPVRLSVYPPMAGPEPRALWLCTDGTSYRVTRLSVRPLSGTGTILR